jgi:hypothetical protein
MQVLLRRFWSLGLFYFLSIVDDSLLVFSLVTFSSCFGFVFLYLPSRARHLRLGILESTPARLSHANTSRAKLSTGKAVPLGCTRII